MFPMQQSSCLEHPTSPDVSPDVCARVWVFSGMCSFANGDALGNGVEVGVEVDALELDASIMT